LNFAIAHRYLLCIVTFQTFISKFTGKNWKFSSIRLVCKVLMYVIGKAAQNC